MDTQELWDLKGRLDESAAETVGRAANEIERLREQLAQARTLILSGPLHMPTWPGGEARNSWVRDANKWLDAFEQTIAKEKE